MDDVAIFDMVVEYLNSKKFYAAEQMLVRERRTYVEETKQGNSGDVSSNITGSSSRKRKKKARLEDLIERSEVTFDISQQHISKMRKSSSGSGKGKEKQSSSRASLDCAAPAHGKANKTSSSALAKFGGAAETQKPMHSLATRLVAFEPCARDPYGSSSMPIYQTATFKQSSGVDFGEYDYTRSGNPTRSALEKQVAELESAYRAFAFSSGMSALAAVTRLAKMGDEIICSSDSYGGLYRLLSKITERQGVSIRFIDLEGKEGPENLRKGLSSSTKLVMSKFSADILFPLSLAISYNEYFHPLQLSSLPHSRVSDKSSTAHSRYKSVSFCGAR